MSSSIHDKLERVRPPRVHIRYEVETNGAVVQKELPFVVGVMGDFSGNPTEPLKPLKDRKFIQIDRDNFNDVMARMTPGLNFRVENTLEGDGSEMAVQLKFNSMEDFEPAKVVEQVEPLTQAAGNAQQAARPADQGRQGPTAWSPMLEELPEEHRRMQALAGELGATRTRKGGEVMSTGKEQASRSSGRHRRLPVR